MPDYRKMYLTLFDGAERAIEALEQQNTEENPTAAILIDAQRRCEEIYIETDI